MFSRLLPLLLATALLLSAVPRDSFDNYGNAILARALDNDGALLGEGMDEVADKHFGSSLRTEAHIRALQGSSGPVATTADSFERRKAVRHDLRIYTLDRTLRI